MAGASEVHVPVLAEEVVQWLQPVSGGIYIDATLGLGGHSSLILKASSPAGRVMGFEWDAQAAEAASARLEQYGDRFHLVAASYAELLDRCREMALTRVDGIVADLGVSSLQLDSRERGFSFMADAPLDMRMDTRLQVTAEQLVNRLKKDELADVLFNYGEERQARRVARFIVEARLQEPIRTTRQLAEIIRRAIPAKYHPKKIHVATRTFQALRIAVNRELDNLVSLLSDAPQLLKPGARICVITFHSLEDRIVKQAFAANPAYRGLTRKPVAPTAMEIQTNPRSRSARLRVAEAVNL